MRARLLRHRHERKSSGVAKRETAFDISLKVVITQGPEQSYTRTGSFGSLVPLKDFCWLRLISRTGTCDVGMDCFQEDTPGGIGHKAVRFGVRITFGCNQEKDQRVGFQADNSATIRW